MRNDSVKITGERELAGDPPVKALKIYGERNTNTNYLSQLVALNLNVDEVPGVVPSAVMTLQKWLPGREMVRDLYFQSSWKKNLGWKHMAIPTAGARVSGAFADKSLRFVTITKNPYSWLLSLHRRPYHQYYRTKPSFEKFLIQPWRTVWRDRCQRKVANPIALWNLKNRSYFNLPPDRSVHLTTESIFQDPATVISRLEKMFSLSRLQQNFVNVEQSTKNENRGFGYYQKYYLDEIWKEDLSRETISYINQNLDLELMDRFGYEVL